jgi:hypothetical protein
MTYYIKKLDNRHAMTKNGFTHMIEWTNVPSLFKSPKSRNEFYAIRSEAERLFGNGWSLYFNIEGKWCGANNTARMPPRIYFKSEKYISLVLMAAEIPA